MKIENTKWAKDFWEECPTSYKYALEYAKKEKLKVFLNHNDENGDWVWAICVENEPDFWMGAKKTKKEAVELCKEMGWKIV